jgi:predicted Mrr-cat superfamily restriction endonuclease
MSYYLIREGTGAQYAQEAHQNNFVAIGWGEVGTLDDYDSYDELKEFINQKFQYTPAQLGSAAGQVFRFGFEMEEGDTVFMPLGNGEYAVGSLGKYFWEEKPKGKCHYQHRRAVEWEEKIYSKKDMSTPLSYGMGAIMTLFSLNKYADEIEALLSGKEYSPAEKPIRIRDQVIAQLMHLTGEEFEEFIMHLLNVVGFEATTTQYTNDKGIDVVGILDAEGLADIIVRVQVKRKSGAIGRKVVQEIRGAVYRDEHPCIITTGTFHKNAIIEAEDANKTPVKLVDGDDLAVLVLKHFDDLDDQYKSLIGIRRKRINFEEQFELSISTDEDISEELPLNSNPKVDKPKSRKKIKFDLDTIVCAAQQEGFESAFLSQKAWWAIRINKNKIPFIKYIAMYQVAPISAITHYGEVDRIEPYQDSKKYIVYLKGEPKELETHVKLGEHVHLSPQAPRYALMEKIEEAQNMKELFSDKTEKIE